MRKIMVAAVLLAASVAHADQTVEKVRVINTPLPVTGNVNVTGSVGITGTPTVNANVTGNVGLTGTPTVNIGSPLDVHVLSKPGITVGSFLTSCAFTGFFCQDLTFQEAPAGKAFRIDYVAGQTLNTGSTPAVLGVNICAPGFVGLGICTSFPVPCTVLVSRNVCTANPGMLDTLRGVINFQTSEAVPASAFGTVQVYYTVMDLAP